MLSGLSSESLCLYAALIRTSISLKCFDESSSGGLHFSIGSGSIESKPFFEEHISTHYSGDNYKVGCYQLLPVFR